MLPRRCSCIVALLLSPAGLFAQPRGSAITPVVPAKVADVFFPAAYSEEEIGGMLATRMKTNLDGRLLHVDEKGIIEGFQHRPGKQVWIGEHAGKFLDAAANTWLYTGDGRLKTLMDRVARELIAAQRPDGYLGTYTDDKRWTAWDVWVHKYDMIGLLAYYQATGYRPALEASRRIGNLLCGTFGDTQGKRDIIRAGEHVGMAATSVLEPMVRLYRLTGEQRYLDFCDYILRAWDEPEGPKIIASLNTTGSVAQTANGKAYEMLSNLVGLAELYRVTGDPLHLHVIETAWNDIRDHRLYLTGTASSGEHFLGDNDLPNKNVGEGCVTVTWLQLSWQLLRLTGESRYAEEIEHTVYNQLLGAQDPASGNICYFTPLNGTKNPGPGISCCVSSEPRGISMIPRLIWGRRGEGAAVLLYTPGRARFETSQGELEIQAETDYPVTGHVRLTLNPQKTAKFPLYLRVPEWTKSYRARAGEERLAGTPGRFLTIDRVWKAGDTVDIDMDVTIRVAPGGRSFPDSVAVVRGPQVLAFEHKLNPDVVDTELAGPSSLDPERLKLRTAPGQSGKWSNLQVYAMSGLVSDAPRTLLLVPFADASTYEVWMRKPR